MRYVAVALVMACTLLAMGRRPWCQCGGWNLWSSGAHDTHTSQHLLDPYSFTHLLHGVMFYALLHLVLGRRTTVPQRFLLAMLMEAGWEVLENTPWIINHYREATFSLEYFGDSVVNSLGDLASMCLGFWFTALVPAWASALTFVVVELLMLWWIRDGLLLNMWMLVFSTDAIKQWQQGH